MNPLPVNTDGHIVIDILMGLALIGLGALSVYFIKRILDQMMKLQESFGDMRTLVKELVAKHENLDKRQDRLERVIDHVVLDKAAS